MAREVHELIVNHVVDNWEEFPISHNSKGDNYRSSDEYHAHMSQQFTYSGLSELVATGQLFRFIFFIAVVSFMRVSMLNVTLWGSYTLCRTFLGAISMCTCHVNLSNCATHHLSLSPTAPHSCHSHHLFLSSRRLLASVPDTLTVKGGNNLRMRQWNMCRVILLWTMLQWPSINKITLRCREQ